MVLLLLVLKVVQEHTHIHGIRRRFKPMLWLLIFLQVHTPLRLTMPPVVVRVLLMLPLHSQGLLLLLFLLLHLYLAVVVITEPLRLRLPEEPLLILIHGTLLLFKPQLLLLVWLQAAIRLPLPMLMALAVHNPLRLLLHNLLLYVTLSLKQLLFFATDKVMEQLQMALRAEQVRIHIPGTVLLFKLIPQPTGLRWVHTLLQLRMPMVVRIAL